MQCSLRPSRPHTVWPGMQRSRAAVCCDICRATTPSDTFLWGVVGVLLFVQPLVYFWVRFATVDTITAERGTLHTT